MVLLPNLVPLPNSWALNSSLEEARPSCLSGVELLQRLEGLEFLVIAETVDSWVLDVRKVQRGQAFLCSQCQEMVWVPH